MADLEVENTLREIRERVLADARRRAPAATTNGATAVAAPSNGIETVAANGHGGAASEPLARMDANLATTGRAWSRLPPLLSYRRGAAARFELWVKRLVKRAAHWFTWEQVNFNSAVHHALGDARAALAVQEQALAAHERALARVREEMREEFREVLREELRALRTEAEADRARAAELQARLARAEAQVVEAQARFESGGAQLRQAFAAGLERIAESQRATAAALREELRGEMRGAFREEFREELRGEFRGALRGELREELDARANALHAETNARAAELHAELRERLDGLLEEQRVCFKQLHAYGTNTKEQQIDLGLLRRGELVEVSFAFDCWLGLDQFSVSLAVHSRDGVSYDWLDGVLFFRVTSPVLVEGIANLNATATARRIGLRNADFGLRIEEEART